MSFFTRLFGDKPEPPSSTGASSFQDSQLERAPNSRSVPRREVVHVVLRETMRRHGIPTDWVECRTLNLVQSNRSTGTYVTLIVKRGQDRLLTYVPAFQKSFLAALQRFDPASTEWLRGVAWQFDEGDAGGAPAMPDPVTWSHSGPAELPPRAASGAAAPAGARSVAATADPADDAALEADLQALFAIRDAALSGKPHAPDAFKPTEHGGL
jgi:hypothetical protein